MAEYKKIADNFDDEFLRWLHEMPVQFLNELYNLYRDLGWRDRRRFLWAVQFTFTEQPEIRTVDIDAIHRNPKYKSRISDQDITNLKKSMEIGMIIKKDKGGKN